MDTQATQSKSQPRRKRVRPRSILIDSDDERKVTEPDVIVDVMSDTDHADVSDSDQSEPNEKRLKRSGRPKKALDSTQSKSKKITQSKPRKTSGSPRIAQSKSKKTKRAKKVKASLLERLCSDAQVLLLHFLNAMELTRFGRTCKKALDRISTPLAWRYVTLQVHVENANDIARRLRQDAQADVDDMANTDAQKLKAMQRLKAQGRARQTKRFLERAALENAMHQAQAWSHGQD